MLYPDYNYTEIITGHVSNRQPPRIVQLNEVAEIIEAAGRVNCYRSHFRFTKAYQDYATAKGSVSGYLGPAYTDYLWIDIDFKDDLNKALETAKRYIYTLIAEYGIGSEILRCCFSGSKGFHVGIPAEVFGLQPSIHLPEVCKHLALELAGGIDIDPSVYDRCKPFRLENTLNRKDSARPYYKVRLQPAELLGSEDISSVLALAVSPRATNGVPDVSQYEGELSQLYERVLDQVVKEAPAEQKQAPGKKGKQWITKFLENGAKPGGRTDALTSLAGAFREMKIPPDIATTTLENWDLARNNPPLTGDPDYRPDKVSWTVNDIYQRYGTLDEEESRKVKFWDWKGSHAAAPEYFERIAGKRLKFGIPAIDRDSGGLGPGEVCYIIGYAHVGKTALAQSIQLEIAQRQQIPSVFFSLEMSAMRLYIRQIAMASGRAPLEVEAAYHKGDGMRYARSMEKHPGIYNVHHVPLTVTDLGLILEDAPEEIGLIIVDYVGMLFEPGTAYERKSAISRKLVQLAKEKQVAVIGIVQTSNIGATGEIELHMCRDSGLLAADADMAIGIWRSTKNQNERRVKLLKARHGIAAGTIDNMGFFGDSPRMIPMAEGSVRDEKQNA